MKKIIIYLAGFLAILSSCSKEMDAVKDTTPRHNVRIIASVKNADTKTTANVVGDKAQYVWQEDEKIKVIDASTTAKDFTLSDAENGYFDADSDISGEPQIAVSPYAALTAVAGYSPLSYSLTLPAEYTDYVPGTTNDVMIGTKSGQSGSDYKFEFKHAAAVMKVTYNNVPIGTKKLVLTADKNINGTFSGLDSDTPVLVTPATGTKTTTLTLEEAVYEANQSLDFYVPVPVATYGQFDIALKDGSNADIAGTVKQKKASTSLAKADYFATPEITLDAAVKGSNWTYTFTSKDELVSSGALVNGLTITSSANADAWEDPEGTGTQRGAQFPQDADPVITIPYTGYIENISAELSCNGTSTVGFKVDGNYIQAAGNDTQVIASGTANKNKTYQVSVPSNHYRKGSIQIELTSDSGKRVYIKSITINDKSAAGLSFEETEFAAIAGAASFDEPVLINPNGLAPITYSSSDTDVATVNASTGEVTIGSKKATTTITASFDGNETYKPGSATYTITVADPFLTLSAGTTPANASNADNSTVSFTVSSNLAWTATKGTDANSIIKGVSQEGNTVTVTFNENTAEDSKSAEVNITPDDDAYIALANVMTVTQRGTNKEDVLTYSLLAPTSGTGYQAFTGRSYAEDGHSTAVYAGKICVQSTDDKIQIRTDGEDTGIITTTSGGSVKKISANWFSGSDGIIIDIYGNNTAYSSAADLFSDAPSTQGTKLGSIKKGTNTYIEVDGYYEYLGIRSNSGVKYLSDITINWGDFKPESEIAWKDGSGSVATSGSGTIVFGSPNVTTGVPTFYNPNGVSSGLSFESSDTDVATVTSAGIVTIVGAGEATLTATFAGDATYRSGSAIYTLTVTDETLRAINKEAASNGSFITKVGDDVVTSAKAGQTVTIVATPNANYATDSILVLDDESGDEVPVADGKFIMPANSVTIEVTFVQTYLLTVADASHGTVTTDPASGSRLKEGDYVEVVVTPDDGYTLNTLTMNGDDIKSDMAFLMPAADATVSATFIQQLAAPASPTVTTISASGFTATWGDVTGAEVYSWILSTASSYADVTVLNTVAEDIFDVTDLDGTGASLSVGTWTLTQSATIADGTYYLYVQASAVGYEDSPVAKSAAKTLAPLGLTLPYSYNDNATNLTSEYITNNSVTDYGTTNAKLRFDATGDYLIFRIATAAESFSINTCQNGSTGGSVLTLSGSEDGSAYTKIADYTINQGQNKHETKSSTGINSSYRYLKLELTTRQSNVGVGKVSIE